jgi:osmotically-inducible protein OsmY
VDSDLTTCSIDAGILLSAEIERALRATGYPALRHVEVATHDWIVFLRGRVPSYYLKQLAQAAVLVVPGVREVRNELNVAYAR